MKELKYINKYLLKYKSKLLFGIFITIIARIFSLIAPRLIGESLNTVEDFIKNKNKVLLDNERMSAYEINMTQLPKYYLGDLNDKIV